MLNLGTGWRKVVELLDAKRPVDLIVVHHTGFDAPFKGVDSWVEIDKAHKAKGWSGIGYHFGVDPDGNIWTLRPVSVAGAHTAGYNAKSIGVVVWGYKKKTREAVWHLASFVAALAKRLNADIHFHSDLSATLCPGLDPLMFRAQLLALGVPNRQIKVGAKVRRGKR